MAGSAADPLPLVRQVQQLIPSLCAAGSAADPLPVVRQVQQLQAQLMELQAGGGGPAVPPSPGGPSALLSQNRRLLEENRRLTRDLQAAIEETTAAAEKALLAERAAGRLKQRLEELYQQTGDALLLMNQSDTAPADQLSHVRDLQSRIMDLQVSPYSLTQSPASRSVPGPVTDRVGKLTAFWSRFAQALYSP